MNPWQLISNSKTQLSPECLSYFDDVTGRVVIVDACNVCNLWLPSKRQSAHRSDPSDSTSSKDDEPTRTLAVRHPFYFLNSLRKSLSSLRMSLSTCIIVKSITSNVVSCEPWSSRLLELRPSVVRRCSFVALR